VVSRQSALALLDLGRPHVDSSSGLVVMSELDDVETALEPLRTWAFEIGTRLPSLAHRARAPPDGRRCLRDDHDAKATEANAGVTA
jgi:hypothetical protein